MDLIVDPGSMTSPPSFQSREWHSQWREAKGIMQVQVHAGSLAAPIPFWVLHCCAYAALQVLPGFIHTIPIGRIKGKSLIYQSAERADFRSQSVAAADTQVRPVYVVHWTCGAFSIRQPAFEDSWKLNTR